MSNQTFNSNNVPLKEHLDVEIQEMSLSIQLEILPYIQPDLHIS